MENAITFAQLDTALGDHAPFLISLSDGLDNSLRIVLSAATVGAAGTGAEDMTNEALREILANCRPILADHHTKYEIYFENYILYQTRNESFATYAPQEQGAGKYLILFETSRLLDSLPAFTLAARFDDGSYFPAPWQHYGIYTQDHVIDVISHCPPKVVRVQG